MIESSDIKRVLLQANAVLYANHYSTELMEDCLLMLLLFKRLSDASGKIAGQEFNIPIPWSEIEETVDQSENIAQKLNEALAAVEEANPNLEGIFTLLGISYWNKFNSEILKDLIQCFSKLNLSDQNLVNPDVLGSVYEDIFEQFAQRQGLRGNRYTPKQITQLIVELIKPNQKMHVCDPVCGSGELLVKCAQYVGQNSEAPFQVQLFGQEPNYDMATLAKINLLLHNISHFDIQQGDVISDPKFVQDNKLLQFDIAVTNPPFNLNYPDKEIVERDPYGRFHYEISSTGLKNSLFIQHILASLNSTGRAAVLMPHGVLSRHGEEMLRQKIVKKDVLEAVIGLAPKLFYNSKIPVVLIIFNRSKSNQNKILFIDARNEYQADQGHNFLQSEHIARIVETYENFKTEEGYSKVVELETIAANDYSLSIERYVSSADQEKLDMNQEVSKLPRLEAERKQLEQQVDEHLKALGIKLYT